MASIFEVLVEAGAEVGQYTVLLIVCFNLLVDPLSRLLIGHSNLVQKDMGNLTRRQAVNIRLALKDVYKACFVVLSRLKDSKHLLDEVAIHEVIHVEDLGQGRVVIEAAPRLLGFIRNDRSCSLLFRTIFVVLFLSNCFSFDVPQHALVLPPVKHL